jgi:predicted anti-sigma-YlaC factor YlaD
MSKAFLAVAFISTGLVLIEGIGVGVGDGDEVGAGIGSTGLKTGLAEGFGAALIATPLFQISFLPDLMQVNFFPAFVAVAPALVHLAPALTAAKEGTVMRHIDNTRARNKRERVMR